MRRIQLGERQRLWWPELAGNKLAAAPEFGRRRLETRRMFTGVALRAAAGHAKATRR